MLNDPEKDFYKNYRSILNSKEPSQSKDDLLEQIEILEQYILGFHEITTQACECLLKDDIITSTFWMGQLLSMSSLVAIQIENDQDHDPITP